VDVSLTGGWHSVHDAAHVVGATREDWRAALALRLVR
jgi:hypothetical protein